MNPLARKTAPAQLSADLTKMVTIVAQHRGQSVAAVLDPVVRGWVTGEYRAAIRAMKAELDAAEAGARTRGTK